MKGRALTVFSAFASLATAQGGALGTKADMVAHQPSSSAIGAWDMVQMIVALAVVFVLLKWALPKIVTKLNKKMGSSSSEGIRLEDSAMFAGCQLQVVSVKGRTLLIGATPNAVSCLADLTTSAKTHEPPAFFELVDRASDATPDFVSEADKVALERLSRLAI